MRNNCDLFIYLNVPKLLAGAFPSLSLLPDLLTVIDDHLARAQTASPSSPRPTASSSPRAWTALSRHGTSPRLCARAERCLSQHRAHERDLQRDAVLLTMFALQREREREQRALMRSAPARSAAPLVLERRPSVKDNELMRTKLLQRDMAQACSSSTSSPSSSSASPAPHAPREPEREQPRVRHDDGRRRRRLVEPGRRREDAVARLRVRRRRGEREHGRARRARAALLGRRDRRACGRDVLLRERRRRALQLLERRARARRWTDGGGGGARARCAVAGPGRERRAREFGRGGALLRRARGASALCGAGGGDGSGSGRARGGLRRRRRGAAEARAAERGLQSGTKARELGVGDMTAAKRERERERERERGKVSAPCCRRAA